MENPTWAEKLILLAAIAVSVYAFWQRFGKVAWIIRSSRKDIGFTLGAIAARARVFLWEVLLQSKVISQRPLPGLAHALVYWGFLAFALVTVNHFAAGFGAGFLTMEGSFGRFYFAFAAVFAVLVSVGIIGLAIRRFVFQPKWLGPVKAESGIIAFLIFALMATYLADYMLQPKGIEGRLLWWLHTATILGFLPLVPHTKHMHLLISPLTVFLKWDGFSKIPPLVGDEDFGLDTGKDVTRIAALQAFTCVECGRCTEHCPAYNTGKILNPKEIILGVRGYLNEFGPGGEEPSSENICCRKPSSSAPPAARVNSSALSASSTCPPSSDSGAEPPTQANGKMITAPSCSSISNTTAIRWASLRASGRSSWINNNFPSTTARRNTASGSAAWAPSTPRARRLSWPSPRF